MANRVRLDSPLMTGLAIAGVALVFIPVLPGLYWALRPGFSPEVWYALLANNEWPQALLATLTSALLSTALALLDCRRYRYTCFPRPRVGSAGTSAGPVIVGAARGVCRGVGVSYRAVRLVGAYRGSGARLGESAGLGDRPGPVRAEFGSGPGDQGERFPALGAALLGEQDIARQMTIALKLGYSRTQTWYQILWPQLLPRASAGPWPPAFAYGLRRCRYGGDPRAEQSADTRCARLALADGCRVGDAGRR